MWDDKNQFKLSSVCANETQSDFQARHFCDTEREKMKKEVFCCYLWRFVNSFLSEVPNDDVSRYSEDDVTYIYGPGTEEKNSLNMRYLKRL